MSNAHLSTNARTGEVAWHLSRCPMAAAAPVVHSSRKGKVIQGIRWLPAVCCSEVLHQLLSGSAASIRADEALLFNGPLAAAHALDDFPFRDERAAGAAAAIGHRHSHATSPVRR